MTERPPLPVPPELVEAFRRYERALVDADLDTLDALTAGGASALAAGADGLLVGREHVVEARRATTRPQARRLVQTHVQVTDAEHALVVAVAEHARGGRTQQTQLWALVDDRWQVTAAHTTPPAPALDTRVWRVVGDPLVHGNASGPLLGESVAVKDVYAVAGHAISAGNPAWEAASPVERSDARVVESLIEAGADLRGIARTDEFAWSILGMNAHHGTPPNPRAPGRVPGGSSSGPASAVALGQASIGLGTDTAGSCRAPAAFCGLFGVRTSHGSVSTRGMLPLAPSFDTVGWLTRDAATLQRVGDVLLPPDSTSGSADLVVVPELLGLATPDVRSAVESWVGEQGLVVREGWPLGTREQWLAAFVTWQSWQAWQSHGAWLADRLDTIGWPVRERFEFAAGLTQARADDARAVVDDAAGIVLEALGDRVAVLPTTAAVAPLAGPRAEAARGPTLQLTAVASIAGAPVVSLPLRTRAGLPCGVSLMAAPGRDRALLDLATALS
ncbi:AtzH-like domain-containing protein [Nocardioides acrostichi]|uniref:DUF3225 domain-containing protein n=1 Tax=Nocardioides acrostichi TaxID=2784339 RepID=A0A930UYF0_9ACTN|nr:AtzH-like domain-containing protein [Nocardioides acrostichi]MBF4162401.1 DUF3225 domain-containing protein [Nocardioides acrostichi]